MHVISRSAPHHPTPLAHTQYIANRHLATDAMLRLLAGHNDELARIERVLDVVASPEVQAARDDDRLPAGRDGSRLRGRARELSPVDRRVLATVLPRLFSGGERSIGSGWTQQLVLEAVQQGGSAQLYVRATLGAGSGDVFSCRYGRQRTRDTNYVKVRWHLGGQEVPHICRVEYYLLLRPPPPAPLPAGMAGGGGSGQERGGSGGSSARSAPASSGQQRTGGRSMPSRPLRIALTTAHPAALACARLKGMWLANANQPSDGGTLWPVLLERIDCKLVVASPRRNVPRGPLYGLEYSALSRVA